PMLDPHGDGAAEQRAHRVRRRGGREVEVVILDAEQVVPYRAADAPRLEAGLFELAGDPEDGVGDGELGREAHDMRNHPHNTEPPLTLRISPVTCRASAEH